MLGVELEKILSQSTALENPKNPFYLAYTAFSGAFSVEQAWKRDKGGFPYIVWVDRIKADVCERLSLNPWNTKHQIIFPDMLKAMNVMMELPEEVA